MCVLKMSIVWFNILNWNKMSILSAILIELDSTNMEKVLIKSYVRNQNYDESTCGLEARFDRRMMTWSTKRYFLIRTLDLLRIFCWLTCKKINIILGCKVSMNRIACFLWVIRRESSIGRFKVKLYSRIYICICYSCLKVLGWHQKASS